MAAPQHAGRPAVVPIWIHRMRSGFDRYVATIMDNHRWSWSKFSVNIEAGIDILKRSETATRTATRTESSCYQALPRPRFIRSSLNTPLHAMASMTQAYYDAPSRNHKRHPPATLHLVLAWHSSSHSQKRPRTHPARRDPRHQNKQNLTFPAPQAACVRDRPNFGKRKQLMATKHCITFASHHMRIKRVPTPKLVPSSECLYTSSACMRSPRRP